MSGCSRRSRTQRRGGFIAYHDRPPARNQPKITILIPTFNHAHILAEWLDSIPDQTLAAVRILVVNDSSTAHTREILDIYEGKIDYLETPKVGKNSAINKVLEKTIRVYLWIFDDDDVALPEALERLVEPLQKGSDYGFSYCHPPASLEGTDSTKGMLKNTILVLFRKVGEKYLKLGLAEVSREDVWRGPG